MEVKNINRKVLIPISIVFLGVFFTGCMGGGYPEEPSGVVEAFVSEMNAGNVEGMKKYLSSDVVDQMEAEGQESSFDKEGEISVQEIKDQEIDGDTATVTATLKMSVEGQSATSDVPFKLKKEDGDWKIASMGLQTQAQQGY